MSREIGRMPSPEEIAAIEWEARRMRGEVIRAGAVALARAVRRLVARPAAAPSRGPVARTTARA